MTDHPAVVSVVAAEDLLRVLREAKDEFRAVDRAVAVHLRRGHSRALHRVESDGGRETLAASAWSGGVSGGLIALNTLGDLPQLVTGLGGAVAGSVGFVAYVRQRQTNARAAAAETESRCDDFLFAGTAFELAVGDLGVALAEARRGLPGAATTVTTQAAQARQAFERYLTAVRTLTVDDVSVTFPWANRKIDVEIARELLGVNTEAVLAQIDFVASGGDSEDGQLGRPRAIPASKPRSGLEVVINNAVALRKDLTVATQTLNDIEDTLQAVAPREQDDVGDDTPSQLSPVTEAQMRGGFLRSDCHAIETAARLAASAHTRLQALGKLRGAPPTSAFRRAFESYASSVQAVVAQVAADAGDEAKRGAVAAARRVQGSVPELARTANTLVVAMDAELEFLSAP